MQDTYKLNLSDLLNHINSEHAEKYPVIVRINGEYYDLINDTSVLSRDAVTEYIRSYIHEIITESGIDKNAHTNSVLRSIIDGLQEATEKTNTGLPF